MLLIFQKDWRRDKDCMHAVIISKAAKIVRKDVFEMQYRLSGSCWEMPR